MPHIPKKSAEKICSIALKLYEIQFVGYSLTFGAVGICLILPNLPVSVM